MRRRRITAALWRRFVIGALFTACLLAKPSTGSATDLIFAPEAPGFPDLVGLGVGLVPDYEGSDDYTPALGPLLRLNWGQRDLTVRGNNFSTNLIDHPWFRLGPSGTLRFARDDVDDDAVDRLEDVDTALELGLTVGFEIVNDVNSRYRFSGDLEITHDVLDAHDGLQVQARLRYWAQLAKWLDFSIGGGVTWASEDYNDTYFGIDASDSARSGLDQFDADAGFKDFRVTPLLLAHLSEQWHVGGGVMIKQLVGDAADSPVVDDRGSETQILAAISVIYSW